MDAVNQTRNRLGWTREDHRFRRAVTVSVVFIVMVQFVVLSGVVPYPVARAVNELAQLAGSLAATAACLWSAVRARGADRAWRLLMGAGMAGWSFGQIVWTYARLVLHLRVPLPAPSPADAGYLAMPVFAVAALLVLARHRVRDPTRFRNRRLRLLLDGMIAAGSLFIVIWASSLASVVRAGAASPSAFAVAVAYPVSGLVLLVIVVFLASDPLVVWQRQLRLLGLGLLGFTAASTVYAYLVGIGVVEIPLTFDVGFLLATVLIALAALAPREGDRFRDRTGVYPQWAHLLTPYVPLLMTGVILAIDLAYGHPPDIVELWVGAAVVVIVVIRQLITIIDNAILFRGLEDSRRLLEHQAYHDPLTGLANRALFHRRLDEAVAERSRFGLLFVDLDDFKGVNDQAGHARGDRVLAVVGRRLERAVRSTDLVARLGGDEFGVLVAGRGENVMEDVQRIGDRIVDSLREEIVIDGGTHAVRASVGLVIRDERTLGLSPDDLIRRADAAMYRAKRDGKGRVYLSVPGSADVPVRRTDREHTSR